MSEETPREFDLHALVTEHRAEQSELFAGHLNPRFVKVLRTIGFDRTYVRGEGSYLWDDQGHRYLDMLCGFGMFNIGRNHPVVKAAVRDYLELNDPWKIPLGTTLLPGLLAEKLLTYAPHLDKVTFPTRAPSVSRWPSSSPAPPPAASGSSTVIAPSTG